METSSAQICQDVMMLLERFKHTVFALAEDRGLSRAQLFAIYWIYQRGEIAMGQMAEVLACDASNVTGLVDRMMAQGLVTRHESERDRRIKTLRLTPKAKKVIEDLLAMLPHQIGCDRLSGDERRTLHLILQKIGVTKNSLSAR